MRQAGKQSEQIVVVAVTYAAIQTASTMCFGYYIPQANAPFLQRCEARGVIESHQIDAYHFRHQKPKSILPISVILLKG